MWDITNHSVPSPMIQNKANQTVLKSRTVWAVVFVMVQQPVIGQVLPIIEASRLCSDTPPSVGLLWTNDRLVADTCTWRHVTLIHNRQTSMQSAGFEPQSQQTLDHAASGFGGFWTILALIHYHYVHWKKMDCINKLLWVYPIFWEEPDCQKHVMPVSVAAQPARPAEMMLNDLCASSLRHCKRVCLFVVQRFRTAFITSACYCFASCLTASRYEDVYL